MEQYFKDKIQMRDVRNLKIVRNYPHQFTEDVDIYFRCDLLRIACSIEDLETEQDPFTISIYTDWSLKLRRKRLAAFLGLFNGWRDSFILKKTRFSFGEKPWLSLIWKWVSHDGEHKSKYVEGP